MALAGTSALLFVFQSLSCVRLSATPWSAARQASYPSVSPGVCSNSRPLSQWCHSIVSSSVALFSSFSQNHSMLIMWFYRLLNIKTTESNSINHPKDGKTWTSHSFYLFLDSTQIKMQLKKLRFTAFQKTINASVSLEENSYALWTRDCFIFLFNLILIYWKFLLTTNLPSFINYNILNYRGLYLQAFKISWCSNLLWNGKVGQN